MINDPFSWDFGLVNALAFGSLPSVISSSMPSSCMRWTIAAKAGSRLAFWTAAFS